MSKVSTQTDQLIQQRERERIAIELEATARKAAIQIRGGYGFFTVEGALRDCATALKDARCFVADQEGGYSNDYPYEPWEV